MINIPAVTTATDASAGFRRVFLQEEARQRKQQRWSEQTGGRGHEHMVSLQVYFRQLLLGGEEEGGLAPPRRFFRSPLVLLAFSFSIHSFQWVSPRPAPSDSLIVSADSERLLGGGVWSATRSGGRARSFSQLELHAAACISSHEKKEHWWRLCCFPRDHIWPTAQLCPTHKDQIRFHS